MSLFRNYIRRIIISSEVDSLDFQIRQVYLSNPGQFENQFKISVIIRWFSYSNINARKIDPYSPILCSWYHF